MENKVYTLKVSLNSKIFRTIEIRGDWALYDLASFIVKSFNFDFDHAFGFYNDIENHYDSTEAYELFVDMDDDQDGCLECAKGVKGTEVRSVFELKKEMLFLFDYGDDWFFLVECINISNPVAKTKYPRLVEKAGRAPKQYQ